MQANTNDSSGKIVAQTIVQPIVGYGVGFGAAFAAGAIFGPAVLPLISVVALGAIIGTGFTVFSLSEIAHNAIPQGEAKIAKAILPLLFLGLIITIGVVVMGALGMPFTLPAIFAAIGLSLVPLVTLVLLVKGCQVCFPYCIAACIR